MNARWYLMILVAASVVLAGGQAQGLLFLDLADMVGGGDGTGTGTPNTGINPRNGGVVVGITSSNNPGTPNIFSTVAHPYIDGVFVGDGGGGATTQVSSTGITVNLPNTDGNSWENGMGYNAACCGGQLRIGGVVTDVFGAPHSGIGFHSNKGITFDLDAIRAATGEEPTRYTSRVDVRVGSGGSADVDHFVYLDGTRAAQALGLTDNGSDAVPIDVPISSGDRFLTLVGSTGPDGNYSFDQGIIGDPRLLFNVPPGDFGTVAKFEGPGDLDLEGDFAYAINVTSEGSPDTRTVAGLDFTRDPLVAGATINFQNPANNWGTKPEYGPTADDGALEEIMWDIKWSASPNPVGISLDVDPGQAYKLQLLFSENFFSQPGSRTFDIFFEGLRAVEGLDILDVSGPRSGSPTAGAVFSYEFIAPDSVLNIDLVPGGTAPDQNPIINALTLESVQLVIPEPSTVLIWSLLGIGLALGAGGRRSVRRAPAR